jgi:hypothetical protein
VLQTEQLVLLLWVGKQHKKAISTAVAHRPILRARYYDSRVTVLPLLIPKVYYVPLFLIFQIKLRVTLMHCGLRKNSLL